MYRLEEIKENAEYHETRFRSGKTEGHYIIKEEDFKWLCMHIESIKYDKMMVEMDLERCIKGERLLHNSNE